MNMAKAWAFCCPDSRIQELASVCSHPKGSHANLRGINDDFSTSAASAAYLEALASKIVSLCAPANSTDCFKAAMAHDRVHNDLVPPSHRPPHRHCKWSSQGQRSNGRDVYIGRGTPSQPPSFWANPLTIKRYGLSNCLHIFSNTTLVLPGIPDLSACCGLT